jgi:hypothetical protein
MKRVIGKVGVVLAIALATTMVGGNAYAEPGTGGGAVTGQGTILPGLTTTPTNQTVSFTGTFAGAVVVGTQASAGLLNCSFNGGGAAETQATALNGNVSGSCSGTGVNGASVSLACSALAYVRVGAVVVVHAEGTCTFTVNGHTSTAVVAAGAFVFVPDQAPPAAVTSYKLAGAAGGVGT